MGSCLSTKSKNAKTPSVILNQTEPINATPQVEKKRVQEEPLKKEIFVIKHRKSHEIERKKEQESGDVVVVVKKDDEVVESVKNGKMGYNGAQVRTSSCTKEEVDAILIQCGRLSRSSSTGKAGLSGSAGSCENNNGGSSKGGKRYCGSKRSFDFDNENSGEGRKGADGSEENEGDAMAAERGTRYRNRNRSRTPSSPGKGRRRTPSREREQGQQQGRSGSRERGVNGSGRRVSRSPGRRSESPNSSSNGAGYSSGNGNSRPQKMVSVPATVTSLAMDKSTNGDEGVSAAAIKRIQVKRNVGSGGDVAVGGTRAAASPRARSPARNVQNQQPISLSRSNSRKNEQSPFRRNPLSDIDTNVVLEKMPVPGFKTSSNNVMSQALTSKLNGDNETKLSTNVNVVVTESLKPQGGVGRTRSSRLSRDLDINPEDLTNANPSYTSLLLEDIQNFHQKNTTHVPTVTLPACVSKAHSIIEALADLNSGTGSNLSSALSGNRRRSPLEDIHHSKEISTTEMRKFETKETFGKSQVVVANDDIMQPSFHKYVTVRRGTLEGSELEEQESSGSNSFVAGSQQQWVSSSSWEPTSADSTDRWTSRSNKEDEFNPLGFQRQAISDTGREVDETRRRVVVKRKDGELQQNGIGRGRVGARGQYTTQTAATASS